MLFPTLLFLELDQISFAIVEYGLIHGIKTLLEYDCISNHGKNERDD